MDFRTTIKPNEGANTLRHSDKMMMLGSCFSDNIGARLRGAMIDVLVNPFGTLYNPMSIASAIHRIIDCEPIAGIDLFEQSGVWNSYAFHSKYSMSQKEATLQLMNRQIASAHEHLRDCDVLMITLGTSIVYRLKSTGEVVANCHKVAANEFNRQMSGVKEIGQALQPAMQRLWEFNPKLKVIFTVSPIRHIADGLEYNSLSKAMLRVAIEQVVRQNKGRVTYFPAYEILIDDLRDYRFYASDMIHPSEVAIDYIWQIFQASYFDDKSCQAIARCERVSKRLQHRPMSKNREVVERFNADTQVVLQKLAEQYPYLKLENIS